MIIAGLQKMTLLDYPGRVACTVFLPGCDFRCPFCHNYELITGPVEPAMTEEAFFDFLGRRRHLLDGIAVTGGEPCLHRELPDFLRKIRDLGFSVKLDTNGNHPEILQQILEEGLADYIAMDVKNSPARYAETAGLETFDPAGIEESIRLLMQKAPEYEFRTTVVDELHEARDFHAIGAWIRGAKRYYLQAFTDRDTVPFEGFHAPPAERMEEYLDIVRSYVPSAELRGMDL